jgi:acylglycerol lipase
MSTIKSKDGTSLRVHHWPASSPPRARVTIVHGYGEHGARYAELGLALNQAGFDALAYDQRGHGESGGRRGFCDRFEQYLEDLDAILAEHERLSPGVPRLLLAHSFGGLVATLHIIERGNDHAGLVLSGPLFRVKLQVPLWKTVAARAAARIYPALALPSGLSGAAVARDPEIARAYDADPLSLENATAGWYVAMIDAQARAFAEAGRVTLPLLLMHGEADVVTDPVASAEIFPRFGSPDKTLELLASAFHEIFNEPPDDRRRIIGRTIEWLQAHTGAQPASRASL